MAYSPITDAERRGWQRRAVRVLDRLLGLDLPPLAWTIGPTAVLVGRVFGPDDIRRSAWRAWVTALDATPAPDNRGQGVTDLRATARDQHDGVVQVVLLTTVYDPDPDPDADGGDR